MRGFESHYGTETILQTGLAEAEVLLFFAFYSESFYTFMYLKVAVGQFNLQSPARPGDVLFGPTKCWSMARRRAPAGSIPG